MKKILFLISLSTLSVFLFGCEPMVFGMPQSQWQTLTPAQQKQVITGYNRRKAIKEKNKPIVNAIDTAGGIIRQKQDLHDPWHYGY